MCKVQNTCGSTPLAVLCFVVAAAMGVALAQEGPFSNASLQGRYGYSNATAAVGSFGIVEFDGEGNVAMSLKANRPVEGDAREVIALTASGTYAVEPEGIGVITVTFEESGNEVPYDFVATATERAEGTLLITELFAVHRSGGVTQQLVAPLMRRIAE